MEFYFYILLGLKFVTNNGCTCNFKIISKKHYLRLNGIHFTFEFNRIFYNGHP